MNNCLLNLFNLARNLEFCGNTLCPEETVGDELPGVSIMAVYQSIVCCGGLFAQRFKPSDTLN